MFKACYDICRRHRSFCDLQLFGLNSQLLTAARQLRKPGLTHTSYITGILRAGEPFVLWWCTVANVRADNRSRGVGLETPKPLGRKMDANESFSQYRRGSVKTGPH